MTNDLVSWPIGDDEYVFDRYLSVINFFLLSICIYIYMLVYMYILSIGCPHMTFIDVYFDLVEIKNNENEKSNFIQ